MVLWKEKSILAWERLTLHFLLWSFPVEIGSRKEVKPSKEIDLACLLNGSAKFAERWLSGDMIFFPTHCSFKASCLVKTINDIKKKKKAQLPVSQTDLIFTDPLSIHHAVSLLYVRHSKATTQQKFYLISEPHEFLRLSMANLSNSAASPH